MKSNTFLAIVLVSMTGVPAAAQDALANLVEPNPKTMSPSEIREFNSHVEKAHPFYIRCKRAASTGSLVSRESSCRTNQQWALADTRGNQEARDIMDDMSSKAANGQY